MVKLSPQGQTRWERFYKDTDNFWHRLVWSQIDTRANLYVTGDADSSGSIDFCTMKMDSSGNTIWVREYNSPDNLRDEPLYVVPDNLGNVYVAGWSVYEERGEYKAATLVKYDSLGVQLWASRYGSGDTTCELGYGYYSDPDGVSPPPAFCPLTVGDSGTAYLTGDVLSRSESRPAFVVKYDSVGSRVWLKRRYSSQGNACSGAIVQLDKRGGMFFIGAVPSLSDDNWDLYVVKYRGR
jgi:hypothetical protein